MLLTTSCTSALELTALMLDLQPGDTVIVPSFTFTTTALAFVRQGARIKFCDIEPVTLGLDTEHLKTLLDDTVRAVVPVHYAGVACDIDGLRKALADWPDVAVIEDNAHGLFGRWNGQPLGTLGRFATAELPRHQEHRLRRGRRADRQRRARRRPGASALREGHQPERLLPRPGRQVLVEGHRVVVRPRQPAGGVPAAPSSRSATSNPGKRRDVFERYEQALAPMADELGIRLPVVPSNCEQTYHMFYVLMPDRPARDALLEGMREHQITPTFHYVPLHSSEAGRRFSAEYVECPVTDDISGRLVRLPFYNNLTSADE